MKNFYILKDGVRIQGIYGPYKTKAAALRAFKIAYNKCIPEQHCMNDFDGYHDYYIIDKLPKFTGETMSDWKGELIPYESKGKHSDDR